KNTAPFGTARAQNGPRSRRKDLAARLLLLAAQLRRPGARWSRSHARFGEARLTRSRQRKPLPKLDRHPKTRSHPPPSPPLPAIIRPPHSSSRPPTPPIGQGFPARWGGAGK